ncbi:hypothetical protein EG831_08320, partial [bacterium]|nr:hypothetical protein [bacterium]
ITATAALCPAQEAKRTAVAVMPLRGSAVSEADARFLTERLGIELSRTGAFELLEREKMAEILREQGFQQTGACDETACLVEVGRLLPVEKMIGGAVGHVGNVYSAQVRLIDLRTGVVERTATRDYKGELEYLLTVGMRETAEELAGKTGPQAQAQAQPAALTSQTETMMRGFMEAQYDENSKSRGWATVWSIIPGCGNVYARNYGAGILFFIAGVTAHSAYATADEGAKGGKGAVLLAVRAVDWAVAMRSVGRYNAKLRKKYGLTTSLTPFQRRPALALAGTF